MHFFIPNIDRYFEDDVSILNIIIMKPRMDNLNYMLPNYHIPGYCG